MRPETAWAFGPGNLGPVWGPPVLVSRPNAAQNPARKPGPETGSAFEQPNIYQNPNIADPPEQRSCYAQNRRARTQTLKSVENFKPRLGFTVPGPCFRRAPGWHHLLPQRLFLGGSVTSSGPRIVMPRGDRRKVGNLIRCKNSVRSPAAGAPGRQKNNETMHSMLRNNASGPEIRLPDRILAGLLPGKH